MRLRAARYLFVLVLSVLLLVGCHAKTNEIRLGNPIIKEMTVYILPIGGYPQSRLKSLQRNCETFIGLNVEILEPYPLLGRFIDPSRGQLDVSALIQRLNYRYPQQVGKNKLLIGIVHEDIFTPDRPDWRFAFASRETELMTTVISSFRLDPVTFGGSAQEALLEMRLRKFVKRQIGFMLLQRSPSRNPRNLFYFDILGIEDVDRLEEKM